MDSVTISPGVHSVVVTGGVPVTAIDVSPNGGVIMNPLTAADQGIGAAEPLYVNPLTTPAMAGNGSTFALQPGQSWTVIPGQTTPTRVVAATAGHNFSVISY